MAINETLCTSGSWVFSGTWVTNTTNNAQGGGGSNTRSGQYQQSNTNGSTATWTCTGHDIFLNAPLGSPGGKYTVTIDGVAQPGYFTCYSGANQNLFQTLVQLNTTGKLADTTHTVVITVGSGGYVFIDSGVAVTGGYQAVNSGVWSALGDSWTAGYGVAADKSYPAQMQRLMTMMGVGNVSLANHGVNGTCLASQWVSTNGGIRNLWIPTAVPTDNPQYLTMLFGINDLGNPQNVTYYSVDDYVKFYTGALQFLQAAYNVNNMVISIGTPQWSCGGFYYGAVDQVGTVQTISQPGYDRYESAVTAIKKLAQFFPWLRVADIYSSLDYNPDLLNPNTANDGGLHPNESGCAVVALEFIASMFNTNGLAYNSIAQPVYNAGAARIGF